MEFTFFYLALPSSLYENVAQFIGRTGLLWKARKNAAGYRIVIEKPTGRGSAFVRRPAANMRGGRSRLPSTTKSEQGEKKK